MALPCLSLLVLRATVIGDKPGNYPGLQEEVIERSIAHIIEMIRHT